VINPRSILLLRSRFRPGLATIALAVMLALASASAAVTTSITFSIPGFQVMRVWAGSPLSSTETSRPSLGIPANLGAILFSRDGNTLYIVGAADDTTSGVYAVSVVRDAITHEVTDLVGPATLAFSGTSPFASTGLDAGLEFGPSGTLFYSYFDANRLAERVGTTEMQFSLNPLGVPRAIAGFTFSPFRIDPGTGFGRLQINTGYGSNLYELSLSTSGGGFFAPAAQTLFATLPKQSLAGMQYVPSAPFAGDLMYVANDDGELHIVTIDPGTGLAVDGTTHQPTLGTANPVDTRFASGFGSNATSGPFGLEFDPINNDLFVSTWQGDPSVFNSIVQIQGFSHVTTTTSTTSTTATIPTTTTTTSQPTTTQTTASTSTTTSTTQPTTTSTSPTSTTTTLGPPACGDVNGDGLVNVGDALLTAQYDVGLRICGQGPFTHPEVCDVNDDGSCNIGDALRMAQCDAGLVSCAFACRPFTCP